MGTKTETETVDVTENLPEGAVLAKVNWDEAGKVIQSILDDQRYMVECQTLASSGDRHGRGVDEAMLDLATKVGFVVWSLGSYYQLLKDLGHLDEGEFEQTATIIPMVVDLENCRLREIPGFLSRWNVDPRDLVSDGHEFGTTPMKKAS